MPVALRRTADDGENEDEIGEGTFYEMLGNARRRHVLRFLYSATEPVSVGELATYVAAAENGVPADAVTPDQRKSAYTALHQNHLGRLANAGLIRAERRWDDIELTPTASELAGRLEDGSPPDPRWRRYSQVLSVVGIATVASFWLGALPSAVAVGAFALLFGLLFLFSALATSTSE